MFSLITNFILNRCCEYKNSVEEFSYGDGHYKSHYRIPTETKYQKRNPNAPERQNLSSKVHKFVANIPVRKTDCNALDASKEKRPD